MHHGEKKRLAAHAALQRIKPGTILGVGTGSTVNELIAELPNVREQIDAVVASSVGTAKRLTALGFEVSELSDTGNLDLYIDGADEANKHFHLIKGGGGALTREKVLASAAPCDLGLFRSPAVIAACVGTEGAHRASTAPRSGLVGLRPRRRGAGACLRR